MEDLSPTPHQQAFIETAKRCAGECLGKSALFAQKKIANAGILGAMTPEDKDGLGLTIRDTLPIVTEMSKGGVSYPVAEAVIAASLAARVDMDVAARLTNGEERATIAWKGSVRASEHGKGWVLNGHIAKVRGGAGSGIILARVSGDSGEGFALIPATENGVSITSAGQIDSDAGDANIILSDVMVDKDHLRWDAGALWQWADAAGAVLHAADIYGAAVAAFNATAAYASQRRQFGRPLTAKQAVRHTLAQDYFVLEKVRYSLEFAALETDRNAEDAATARNVLTGLASEHCVRVAEHAIQLHGAMSFTTELPIHRYLRRILTVSDIRPARAARADLAGILLEHWQGEAR